MATAKQRLDALRRLLDLERAEELAVHERLVRERGLAAFVEAGLALTGLLAEDEGSGLGGRSILAYRLRGERPLPDHRLGPGDVVRVVADPQHPDEGVVGLVSSRAPDRLSVAFDEPPPEWAYGSGLAVVEAPNDVTWRRQVDAMRRLAGLRLSRQAELRDLLLDDHGPAPGFDRPPELAFLDPSLDGSQREAVRRALSARDLSLVHGPPGTGKTTALIEIIRQARRRDGRVLATAASNIAVDNLVERLLDAGEPVIRIGHPVRVGPALRDATLDYRVRADESWLISRRLLDEARELMRKRWKLGDKVERGRARAFEVRDERRALSQEIGRLMDDVRRLERQAVSRVLSRAEIVCATLTGTASDYLGMDTYAWIVIDEATQATLPAALIPLRRAGETARLALAGDHHQLPPTVVSQEAARGGLAVSLFEHVLARHGEDVRRMLTVQYRMHAEVMRFASERFYEGRLTAAEGVRAHLLRDLPGVADVEATSAPLRFIDTAGRGFEEEREEGSESCANPGEADLAAAQVRALLEAGVSPRDVAVISPYAAQVRLLRDRLSDVAGLEIDTVDGFQGREKEAVVVSLARSNDQGEVGFLGDVRRMNVAWTRARRRLVVIGDSATLASHPFYAGMLDYVDRAGAYVSAWELV